MQYRVFDKLGEKLSVLGFGAMRLPVDGGDQGNIKEEESIKLIAECLSSAHKVTISVVLENMVRPC